ncbi:MAG: Co2+/Mg2+ efflux protein ApaG [Paraglaciecola sp.]|uniref:Co2+/Mg2+ efflux protein ApaG n=1 Tax=Paraglaciecola TaxID=1621534 RepID=UPI0010617632|nr:Co2+/Mg2+ efflux protein ApaG [Paraglaciecola marina]
MSQETPIVIDVQTQYLPNRIPEKDKYPFSYTITITNHSDKSVQLMARYWLITDGNGKNTEVRGPGVIGEQPNIKQGESFRYSSGAILDTPIGTMQGFYEMLSADGQIFEAPIDVFRLAVPNVLN